MLYARMLDNSFIKFLYKLREIPIDSGLGVHGVFLNIFP